MSLVSTRSGGGGKGDESPSEPLRALLGAPHARLGPLHLTGHTRGRTVRAGPAAAPGELSVPPEGAVLRGFENASSKCGDGAWSRGAARGKVRPYLIIHVVFVDVVLVKDQFEELPHGVHVHRLQLPGFAACLLVVTERDVAARESTAEATGAGTCRSREPPSGPRPPARG